jgi:hypothetical protein
VRTEGELRWEGHSASDRRFWGSQAPTQTARLADRGTGARQEPPRLRAAAEGGCRRPAPGRAGRGPLLRCPEGRGSTRAGGRRGGGPAIGALARGADLLNKTILPPRVRRQQQAKAGAVAVCWCAAAVLPAGFYGCSACAETGPPVAVGAIPSPQLPPSPFPPALPVCPVLPALSLSSG